MMLNPRIELLWFEDCPNHSAAEAMLRECMTALGVKAPIRQIEVPDEAAGIRHRFPGSPTIRINGRDVEPGWTDCEDCTPRCRLYVTDAGLRGVPEARWLEAALRDALGGGRAL